MGTWALEYNPVLTGDIYDMVNYKGNVFAFCYAGTGSGVWYRTPPGPPLWTRTYNPGGAGRACVWNDLMFAGGWAWPQFIHRSVDGINWSIDHDFSCGGPYSHWSALGGYGDYMYAYQYTMCGISNAFYRRDTTGNWIQYPPDAGLASGHGNDMVEFGGKVYWAYGAASVRYYITYWTADPVIHNEIRFFTTHGAILYAAGSGAVYRRTLTGDWILDMADPGPAWGGGAICVGADGVLYMAVNDGAGNSRVYARAGSGWSLHSATAAADFKSVIFDDAGVLYAGTTSCEFWIYTSDFNLTPIGAGLHNQAMDCDGDGSALYIGLYNPAAQPVLIKRALPMTPLGMGLNMFNPGAGTAINVKCTDVGNDLVIAGNFAAANEQVETSTDGANTWVDIDRDAWGAEIAQPVDISPTTLDEVIVCLQTAQDITETFDAGATAWVVNNAAIGYSPGAMAKMDNGNELIIGDDAANRIDYSPNRGVTLTNITGAFVGNVAALEVV